MSIIGADPKMQHLLGDIYEKHYGVKPFEISMDAKSLVVIVSGTVDGTTKNLEIAYADLMDAKLTEGWLNDLGSMGSKLVMPKPPPVFKKAKTPFSTKPGTQPMDIFAREAFGFPDQKAFHFHIKSQGKLMTSLWSGKCDACKNNMPKGLTIVYGSDNPGNEPAAYHPACYLRIIGGDSLWLRAMPRTLDEMRWRRMSKGSCHNEHAGGQDLTKPEMHKWRCGCRNAPWNLTKRMREAKRKQLGVGAYSPF